MAKHHGVFEDEGADPPFFPVVDIAAADAGVVYGDEGVVGCLDRGLGSLLERDIVRFVENEGEVLIVPVSCVSRGIGGVNTLSVFVIL